MQVAAADVPFGDVSVKCSMSRNAFDGKLSARRTLLELLSLVMMSRTLPSELSEGWARRCQSAGEKNERMKETRHFCRSRVVAVDDPEAR